jgi:hypothetical protein
VSEFKGNVVSSNIFLKHTNADNFKTFCKPFSLRHIAFRVVGMAHKIFAMVLLGPSGHRPSVMNRKYESTIPASFIEV